MNSRISDIFATNRKRGVGSLLPYFTSCFPSASTAAALIRAADAAGASVVEIGEPYSDSIADGPVIQESFYHALERGHRVADTFDLVAGIRRDVSAALVSMVSFSIVHRVGATAYFEKAHRAGFDGVIVPDVPIEESARVSQAAVSAGLDYTGLVAPTTTPQRAEAVVRASTGFVYLVADTGTTGERTRMHSALAERVGELRRWTSIPICVGFGIAVPEHVREVCDCADGAIVGSAIIRRIAEQVRTGATDDGVVAAVRTFLDELMAGTVNPASQGGATQG